MAKFLFSAFADEASHELDKQIEALKRNNLKYIEPRNLDGKTVSKITVEEAKEVAEKLKKGGIKVSSIGSFYGKIEITDDFEPHFENFCKVVEFAKILDTRYIRMFSFYTDSPETARAEVFSRLERFIAYAKEQGVVLLHENEKGIYGDSADRCLDLMQNLYCDNFRMTFDFANFVQCGYDARDAYDKLSKYIEYIHVKDAAKDGENVSAGEGEGKIEEILKIAFENGYSGFLSLEPHLFHFKGLDELETEEIAGKKLSSGQAAFITAHKALMGILERIC